MAATRTALAVGALVLVAVALAIGVIIGYFTAPRSRGDDLGLTKSADPTAASVILDGIQPANIRSYLR